MTCHPLALTQEQMDLIMLAAQSVPPVWRVRLLEGIADELLPLPQITDSHVDRAIGHMLARIGDQAA